METDKNKDQKDQQQQQQQSSQQNNPSVAILTETLKNLQDQNKALQEQLAQRNKDQDDKKQQQLEKDSDLEKLLKGLALDDDDVDKKASPKKKPDLNSLTNEEILDVVSGSVEKFVAAMLEKTGQSHKKEIDTLAQKLDQSQAVLAKMLTMQQVTSLRAQHPDIDEYADDIKKIVEEVPGISLDKAYKLAKAEKMDSMPAPEHVDTEHSDFNIGPSGLPVSRRAQERRAKENEDGRGRSAREDGSLRQFRSFLDAGLERALQNRRT